MIELIEPAGRLQRTIQYLSAVAAQSVGGQVCVSTGSLYATLMDLSAVLASLPPVAATPAGQPAPPSPNGSAAAQMAAFDAAIQQKISSAMAAAEAKLGAAPVAPVPPLDPQQQIDAAMFARILAEPDLKARVKALVDGQPAPAPAPG